MISLCLTEELWACFPKWRHYFTFHPAVHESYSFFISFPVFAIVIFSVAFFFFFLILGTILWTVLKRLGRRILPCAWYLCMLSHFSHVWLCNPMNCSPSGSSVQGILQARILEWVAIPSSRGFSQPRDWTCISYLPCIGRQVLYH